MLERTQLLLHFIFCGSMGLATAMAHNQSSDVDRRRSREVGAAGDLVE
jgi:hypothetical protein